MRKKEQTSLIFTSYDASGDEIVLKDKTWSQKIHPKHPEVTIPLIKEGLEKAHRVTDHDENRRVYRRLIEHPTKDEGHITTIKIVTELMPDGYFEVVTAHIMTSLKNERERGKIIYDAGSSD